MADQALAEDADLAELRLARREHWVAQLERHAAARHGQPAFRFRGTTRTWRQFADRVGRLAGAFASRGVRHGDRVAVMTGNCPEFLEAVLAANVLGAIAVPLNFRLSGPEAAFVLDDSGATVLVVDGMCGPTAGAALAQLSQRPAVLAIGPTEGAVAGSRAYEAAIAEATAPAARVDVAEDAAALIMYTSGTTGRPKGAVLTHHNLRAQCLTGIRAQHLVHDDEVNLVTSPLFHIAGVGAVAPSIMNGTTTVIVPTGAFDSARLLELIEAEGVTSMFLVPAQWQAVCDDPTLPQRDLSRLRAIGWGAAPASDSLLRQMGRCFPGALIVALFGQTEMSPVTCALEGKDALRKLGSVGRPVPGVLARVVDGDMRDVPAGEVGEIVYRGPGLMREYWNKPAATAEAFRGGWFHSGDLVTRDEDGYVWVVDRVKDMIISGGENIYCAEVENALAGHPSVAEVSVVGQPDARWGETPVAFVALRQPATSLSLAELRAEASARLARYKLPTALVILATLPRNASGKVLKGELRKLCPATVKAHTASSGD
ncbi:MAG TPA: long-chain-fatty-acid--CoA ligase [Trebonia sp.]|nr:long-chain-fatty-acid--CoA ligase [Trebonia sp.]